MVKPIEENEQTAGLDHEPEFLIARDPELDHGRLEHQLLLSMSKRRLLPVHAPSIGRARLAQERLELLDSIRGLESAVHDYGSVETRHGGIRGWLQLGLKKLLRKLIMRHVLQQHRVHLRLVRVLRRTVEYLEEQEQTLRVALDESEQQLLAKPIPVATDKPASKCNAGKQPR